MQRYFCKEKENDIFTLSSEDSYHITKVMRYNIGTNIEIVYDNTLYIANIINLSGLVKAQVIKIVDENINSYFVTIAQSLVKEQKMDYILQKGTELGASCFIPLDVTNSIVKLNGKENKKIERWRKVVKEASEQSKRLDIPIVTNILSIDDLVKEKYDLKILCSVNETSKNIKTVLSNIKQSDRILFVIGPEGGFTDQEEQKLKNNDFISTSLGSRVLRTETASTFVLSIINYIFMR